MRVTLRLIAVLIALAGVVDPSLTRKVAVPASIDVALPPSSHPDYTRAVEARDHTVQALHGTARFDDVDVPVARLAVGRPRAHLDPGLKLFAVPLAPAPLEVEELRVPTRVLSGQQVDIQARLRARGLDGENSLVELRVDGVTIATADYRWKGGDETHSLRFAVPALPEGTHRLQVAVRTRQATVTADAGLAVTRRPYRVFVYEPRPSWPGTFVRRSLERDPRFELSALSRNAPRIAATSGEATSLDTDRLHTYDAVVVGGLEGAPDRDLAALEDFVLRRGGALMLLPDRRIPEQLRVRFGLPVLDEVLVQDPILLEGPGFRVRASELLVVASDAHVTELAGLRRQGRQRPVVFAKTLGLGTIVVHGAMDAWRYRSTPAQDLDAFTRAVVAELAATAPPSIAVALARSIERPGEPIALVVTLRETEFTHSDGGIHLPPVTAALVGPKGTREMVRLWPTSRPGEFQGQVTPAVVGRYVVEAAAGSRAASTVLTVADDVTRPRDSSYPLASVAGVTGGAIEADPVALRASFAGLGAGEDVRRVWPMRSGWWIVPFAGLLSAEWALRRRVGLR